MKSLIGACVIAFSMYSRIPMPKIEWTKERMRYALCFFPMIGVVIGILIWLGVFLWNKELLNGQNPVFFACMGTVIPLLVTGGIHMDGFLDVTDARSSYGSREKKLDILKDPHTGAFAILGCGVYLLLYIGFFSLLSYEKAIVFAGSFVLTRALSGLSVVCFPKSKQTGLAALFSSQAEKRIVAASMLVWIMLWCVACTVFSDLGTMLVCLAAALLVFFYYYKMSMREFGGITGDLAGYFLQVCELVLLMTVTLVV